MKFGLHKTTKERIEASPGLHANCPSCEKELIPKCGDIKIHHWAHKRSHNCDPWWEPETVWHREWKNKFPNEWQETIKIDKTGEKHRADVYNPLRDLVIEFQNSSIDIKEMESREKFYKKMIWVVNATKFDFDLLPLNVPNEKIEKLEKKFIKKDIWGGSMVYRGPTYEEFEKNFDRVLTSHRKERVATDREMSLEEEKLRRLKIYFTEGDNDSSILKKYYEDLTTCKKGNLTLESDSSFTHYIWSRRRAVWDKATLPVFFDLGDKIVWIKSEFFAKRVTIDKFIKKYGVNRLGI